MKYPYLGLRAFLMINGTNARANLNQLVPVKYCQIFMLNMTKISYLDMSHFLIFSSMREKDGFLGKNLIFSDTKPKQWEPFYVIL